MSYLNAACALAVMNADAAGGTINGAIFSEALMEVSDVSHARNAALDWVVKRFGGDPAAIWHFAS